MFLIPHAGLGRRGPTGVELTDEQRDTFDALAKAVEDCRNWPSSGERRAWQVPWRRRSRRGLTGCVWSCALYCWTTI